MQQRCYESKRRGQANRGGDQADLAYRAIGEHPPDVLLADGRCAAVYDTHETEDDKSVRDRDNVGQVVVGEDAQEHPDHGVGADLRHHGGEQRVDRRRRVGVCVGQPQVQRDHGHLEAEPHEDEHCPGLHGARGGIVPQDFGRLRHVQRARREVEKPNAQQVEEAADRPQDQIAEAGDHAVASALKHQRIGGQRGDFEENEQVEQVARDDDAGQARQQEQHQPIEGAKPVARLANGPAPRCDYDRRRHAGNHQRDERRDVVDYVLDSHRRRPAAQVVVERRLRLQDSGQRPGRRTGGGQDACQRCGVGESGAQSRR